LSVTKARSLLLTAPRTLEWCEKDLLKPSENQVFIKTDFTAVSIGTELPMYLGISRHFNHEYPTMTGYESLGRIIAVGDHVDGLEPGDKVASFYGHRTHALVQANRVIKVLPDISDNIALLSILSCDVAKGIRKLKLDIEKSSLEKPVLVSGAGAIGLLTLFILLAYQVRHVDMIEPHPRRRELASSLGARTVYAPESLLPDVYDYALECSGHNVAFEKLQTVMNHDGTICVLADGHLQPYTLLPEFHSKELKIVGSSDGWDYQEHARWFFGLEKEKLMGLEALFDLEIFARDLPETFAALANRRITPIKVFVKFDDG
jgi:alcohol dehydrogenase